MEDEDRELRDVMLERQALEFLLAHACETGLDIRERAFTTRERLEWPDARPSDMFDTPHAAMTI